MSNGSATLSYDTKGKALSVGANELTIKYVPAAENPAYAANDSLATATVTLTAKALTATLASATAKADYNGTKTFTGIPLTLSGALEGDAVSLNATATLTTYAAAAGTYAASTVAGEGKYTAALAVTSGQALTAWEMSMLWP